jgi:peptide/nickel transport system substrate-binding protein
MRAWGVASLALTLGLAVGAAEGAQGKTLVYHLNGPIESLDPAKSLNSLRARRVMWPIFESLVNLSKDSRSVVPELAESWEASGDGLTYLFHLRRGVKFHDGTPLNATAVKLNLERNYLKESRFYTADPPNVREDLLAGLVRDIVVHDELTIRIVLKNPRMHLLFMVPLVSPDALTKYGRQVGEHPVGTGPFRFVRSTADELRLAAYGDYWGGRPKIDHLTFRVIPESEKTMREFLGGTLDFLPEVEPTYVERIIANPSTRLVRAPTLSTYYLGFRVDRNPFNDLRVRQAVSKAVDVERAILFTSRGTGLPAFGPIPPGGEAHDVTLKKPQFSPDAARQLLRGAGQGDLRVSMLYNAGWGFFAELANAIKADLVKVGVVVDLVPLPSYKELVTEIRRGKGDMFMYSWFTVLPDAEVWLGRLFPSKSIDNLTGYGNAQVDTLLEQARGIADPSTREALYRRIQRMIVDEVPLLPLFHEIRVSAHHTRLVGLELNAQSFPADRFARVEIRNP